MLGADAELAVLPEAQKQDHLSNGNCKKIRHVFFGSIWPWRPDNFCRLPHRSEMLFLV